MEIMRMMTSMMKSNPSYQSTLQVVWKLFHCLEELTPNNVVQRKMMSFFKDIDEGNEEEDENVDLNRLLQTGFSFFHSQLSR